MAKNNPVAITDEQLEAIWKKIELKRINIYSVAREIIGRDVGDEIFDELRKRTKVFKCESCGNWLPLEEEDDSGCEVCTDCVLESIEDEDEDDEWESDLDEEDDDGWEDEDDDEDSDLDDDSGVIC